MVIRVNIKYKACGATSICHKLTTNFIIELFLCHFCAIFGSEWCNSLATLDVPPDDLPLCRCKRISQYLPCFTFLPVPLITRLSLAPEWLRCAIRGIPQRLKLNAAASSRKTRSVIIVGHFAVDVRGASKWRIGFVRCNDISQTTASCLSSQSV